MYKNILVPVLFDEKHNNQMSFQVARALADDNAKFTVAHVVEAIPNFVRMEMPTDLLEKKHDELKRLLADAAKALPGAVPELISGHAGKAILNYADENEIDCIVLASHRPGFEDLLIGSTASRVVRHAKCAVHVVR
ncbi:universal stress protein [Boseongicola aestuarii]|jgi:nucleotide-binding universal stress UspA family protein|uniref:Universal stress protein F n=1 Tax=Boseongicola aestuarii TaxID=1470561 RepID=A0A238J055_9RHOB|nr:universal stress protein [Boseongicola aestuarii]SMX23370.1 Universal stress protein F [Boseongicola aestuarii]